MATLFKQTVATITALKWLAGHVEKTFTCKVSVQQLVETELETQRKMRAVTMETKMTEMGVQRVVLKNMDLTAEEVMIIPKMFVISDQKLSLYPLAMRIL